MPAHPLTNFETQRYHRNEPKLKGLYLRNNLAKNMKDRANTINLNDYKSMETHGIACMPMIIVLDISIALVLNIIEKISRDFYW